MFAVDRSESVGDERDRGRRDIPEQRIRKIRQQSVRGLAVRVRARQVVPARSLGMSSKTAHLRNLPVPAARPLERRVIPADAAGLDRKGTDLAAALEVAAAAIPPFYVPRIVLISDGNPTSRRCAFRPPHRCRARCKCLPSRCPAEPSPRCSSLPCVAPAQVLQGEPFNVEVVIDSQPRRREGTSRSLPRRHQGRRAGREAQKGREPARPQADDRRGRAHAGHGAGSRDSRTRCSITTATSAWSPPPASRGCC